MMMMNPRLVAVRTTEEHEEEDDCDELGLDSPAASDGKRNITRSSPRPRPRRQRPHRYRKESEYSLGSENDNDNEEENHNHPRAGEEEDDGEYDEELLIHAEPLTKDEFSVMTIDNELEDDEPMYSGSFKALVLSMVCILVVAILAVMLPGIRNNSKTLEVLRTPARLPVEYQCKSTTKGHEAENFDPSMTEEYDAVSQSISGNMTEFLESFRQRDFDDWGKTYEEVKQGLSDFKSTYYPPYLEDGSTIYESACGIGLNLFMTLEILQKKGVESLFVYGNDQSEASVEKANAVFHKIPPALSRKGRICPADSSHLGFVPANAFDLVFTGYLSPLLDPLRFNLSRTENYDRYTTLCTSDSTAWAETTLGEIAQQRQNDWFGLWVAEMARIAKPGVPVIVEEISPTYCEWMGDWGGVSKEWWFATASNNTYKWNIDPASIVIEDDKLFPQRYHVFMLKNGKREN